MHANRGAQAWLTAGLLWFLLAIAFAPSNKIYQQGLVVFLWLPTLVFAWSAHTRLVEVWDAQRFVCVAVLSLLGWAALSLIWSASPDSGREVKRLLYISVFLLFFPVLANGRSERVITVMQCAGVGLGLAALISIVRFYGQQGQSWVARLEGIGELSHPILGAYVIAAAIIWLLHWQPRQRWFQVLWVASITSLAAFVVFCQSRGAALALMFTVIAMPIWCRDRRSCLIALGAIAAAVLGFWLLEPLVLARGFSYRPEIFRGSLQMIAEHPVLGLGLGSFYEVLSNGIQFDHSHNMFTHIAIELGLPGLALWLAVWLAVLLAVWRKRDTPFGKGLLGLWVFSTLAMQFDAASISGSPRAEWFITWLPVGLASVLTWAHAHDQACDKIARSS
ncbi:O-antigen ligase [Pseudomonas sp. R5(2019)]|uniref:O-antigen ligase family protein n=1 Tax=Pseudomonas sp. R5(2019) TaxID=2697566 RepID=UPI0014120C5D|nr:O-antigen ligase family protein [Pseudomonas sp. R5(2019)]NBA93960.1 polymerase [Pseudomonas sp. R5(2019)]